MSEYAYPSGLSAKAEALSRKARRFDHNTLQPVIGPRSAGENGPTYGLGMAMKLHAEAATAHLEAQSYHVKVGKLSGDSETFQEHAHAARYHRLRAAAHDKASEHFRTYNPFRRRMAVALADAEIYQTAF